jgi:hypothetical protein
MKLPGIGQKQTYGVNQEKSAQNYLGGQVWNRSIALKSSLSIEIAPGSSIRANQRADTFIVRVRLDIPQREDLKFKITLSGSASYPGDYSISENPNEDITIPAERDYIDITIVPTRAPGNEIDKTIAIVLSSEERIRLGKRELELTIVPARFTYRIHSRTITITSGSPVVSGWSFREVNGIVSAANLFAYIADWEQSTASVPPWTSSFGIIIADPGGQYTDLNYPPRNQVIGASNIVYNLCTQNDNSTSNVSVSRQIYREDLYL